MPRLSERAGKNRLSIFVGLAVVFGAAWFYFGKPTVELVSEQTISAKVVDIVKRNTNRSSENQQGLGIVLIELPDGGRAKVFVPLEKISIGEETLIKVKEFSDGTRRIIAAAASGAEN